MKVAFSRRALASLEQIGDYIAQDNPRRAVTFVRELRGRAGSIGKTPLACPLAPSLEDRGIRVRIHGAYLILYRIQADQVAILLIVHGARDYVRLLDDPGADA